jgi:polysaccharide biosynthesis protein PelA
MKKFSKGLMLSFRKTRPLCKQGRTPVAASRQFFRHFSFVASLVLAVSASITTAGHAAAPGSTVPRVVLGIYDSKIDGGFDFSYLHTLAEMPLNHLGLVLKYHDIQSGLPPKDALKGARGVLSWLRGNEMPDPEGYLKWAEQVVDQGHQFVILGELGFSAKTGGSPTPPHMVNHFLNRLGIELGGAYRSTTFNTAAVVKDPDMVEFERPLPRVLPAYEEIRRIDPLVQSYLVLRRADDPATDSHLVTISPTGGYAASGYVEQVFEDVGENPLIQWQLNPFEFFRVAFHTDDLPKPDVTTLSGRRIYYSHIDGDGWRNQTELEEYRGEEEPVLSAQIILDRAIRAYPDLPVTVAPIAGDLDTEWHGTENSLAIALATFIEPQVEAATHTYSHPFNWEFFADYKSADEVPFLKLYGGDIAKNYGSAAKPGHVHSDADRAHLPSGYTVPRAYGNFPYDLDEEIDGSIDFISKLLPAGKRVELAQWSGDCRPYEAAVEAADRAGVRNINGGDSRFDADFPSHTSVPPVGRMIGTSRQIYASNSNENTYTELWNSRFFGFKYLPTTFENTESPRRLKPLNLYYHMYSGQKLAALNALTGNLDYVRNQKIAPVSASHYAAIGEGFYTTRLVRVGTSKWQVRDRGALQTIRFDNAAGKTVDFERSRGVLGQRHHQGSLYVSLDQSAAVPVVALATPSPKLASSHGQSLRLVDARWRVWNWAPDRAGATFTAQGFGDGEFAWMGAAGGTYEITAKGTNTSWTGKAAKGPNGVMRFTVPLAAIDPIEIIIRRAQTPTVQARLEVGP